MEADFYEFILSVSLLVILRLLARSSPPLYGIHRHGKQVSSGANLVSASTEAGSLCSISSFAAAALRVL